MLTRCFDARHLDSLNGVSLTILPVGASTAFLIKKGVSNVRFFESIVHTIKLVRSLTTGSPITDTSFFLPSITVGPDGYQIEGGGSLFGKSKYYILPIPNSIRQEQLTDIFREAIKSSSGSAHLLIVQKEYPSRAEYLPAEREGRYYLLIKQEEVYKYIAQKLGVSEEEEFVKESVDYLIEHLKDISHAQTFQII